MTITISGKCPNCGLDAIKEFYPFDKESCRIAFKGVSSYGVPTQPVDPEGLEKTKNIAAW
jgi:hypothetical protein